MAESFKIFYHIWDIKILEIETSKYLFYKCKEWPNYWKECNSFITTTLNEKELNGSQSMNLMELIKNYLI